MAFFQKTNPERAMAAKLGVKTLERDKLAGRLTNAEVAIGEAKAAAVKLAADGADDAALDAAEDTLRRLSDRIATLRSASLGVGADVAALERELATHLDTVQRAATAAQIETMAIDLEKLVPEFQKLFDKTVAIAGLAASSQIWDGVGLLNYATASRTQIPAAYELVVRSLRERAVRVLDGRSPAKLVEPDAPRPVPAVKEYPTKRVFTTRKLCWTDSAGKQQSAGKFNDADLPPVIADRALASGAARPIGSELWISRGNTVPISTPPITECENLDLDAANVAVAEIGPSDPRFVKLDRGEPFTLNVTKEPS